MTVRTGGPIRGFIGSWIMRLEAAGGILRMAFLGVTAASTFTSALALIGLQKFAPAVLAMGVLATFSFSYAYVELGVFNRKNREKVEHGNNFARPDMRIDDTITGAAVFAALHGRPPDAEEYKQIDESVEYAYQDYRNGYDPDPDPE